jgi:DNA polymerase V
MSHFVLADCNNFYVSCERLFNPRLLGKPVIVLSNNDGCVVARSQEAKKLGIQMGEPYFKIRDFCSRMKVIVFSSNYQLYGDLSDRVMDILSVQAPEVEIYSIDEAFLKFPESWTPDALFSHCLNLRRIVNKWVGIPISLGIAPTKTLAKVANDWVKKNQDIGVFDLSPPDVRREILQNCPVEDVWGIGSRLKERLHRIGVFTAWQFQSCEPELIRQKMGVTGERMLWELRGLSCLELNPPAPKKSITTSRSFGKIVTDFSELSYALSTFVNTACVKLRSQGSFATALCVYLEAIDDAKAGTRRYFKMAASLPYPSNDTSLMITSAKSCLKKLFDPKERYKKCGVILLDLVPEAEPDFFLGAQDPKRQAIMSMMDAVNEQRGKNALFFGAMGVTRGWKMRSDQTSRRYTTDWNGLALVLC